MTHLRFKLTSPLIPRIKFLGSIQSFLQSHTWFLFGKPQLLSDFFSRQQKKILKNLEASPRKKSFKEKKNCGGNVTPIHRRHKYVLYSYVFSKKIKYLRHKKHQTKKNTGFLAPRHTLWAKSCFTGPRDSSPILILMVTK